MKLAEGNCLNARSSCSPPYFPNVRNKHNTMVAKVFSAAACRGMPIAMPARIPCHTVC